MKRCTTAPSIVCIAALLCLLLFMVRAAGAEEVPVPARLQVPIFLKILTFDRNFEKRVSAELKIGIVFVEEVAASLQVKDEIATVLDSYADRTIKRLPIAYVPMRYSTEQEMAKLAKSEGIDVLYVAPGNAANLTALLRISQNHQIATITGVPQYVREGVTVGLGLGTDNKPLILINLKSAQLEGIAFDANLLRLATVLR